MPPSPKSIWTDVGSYRIHARVAAQSGGRPLVLLHGLVVSSRYMRPLAQALKPAFSVYAPDLPGFGRSTKPAHVLDVAALADAFADWIDALGLAPVAVLSHSFGCQVLGALMRCRPGRVGRAVMVGPTVDPKARTAWRQAWRLLRDAPEMIQLAPTVLRDLCDAGLWGFGRTFQHMLRDRIEENLPHVGVPTLLVRGGNDPVVPQRWAEEATALLPEARLVVLPGAWHAPNFSSPVALARAVRPFLEADS